MWQSLSRVGRSGLVVWRASQALRATRHPQNGADPDSRRIRNPIAGLEFRRANVVAASNDIKRLTGCNSMAAGPVAGRCSRGYICARLCDRRCCGWWADSGAVSCRESEALTGSDHGGGQAVDLHQARYRDAVPPCNSVQGIALGDLDRLAGRFGPCAYLPWRRVERDRWTDDR